MNKTYVIEGTASCETINVMSQLQKTFNLPIVVEQKEKTEDDLYSFSVKSEKITPFRLEWFVDSAETILDMQMTE